jgi:hypothetical protein
MGVSQKADPHPDQCRGPADLGKEIYWIFFPTKDKDVSLLRSEPILTNRGLLGWHFVCKDHGEERHGFWWEQVPDQERDIP